MPVKQKDGIAIIKYTKFGKIETPEAVVNIRNHFAFTILINPSENPIKLTFPERLDIEPLQINETHFIEKLETDIKYDQHFDNLQKANLKNLRLEHCNKEENDAIRKLCIEFRDIFSCEGIPFSFTNQIKHNIKLTNESPIYTKS